MYIADSGLISGIPYGAPELTKEEHKVKFILPTKKTEKHLMEWKATVIITTLQKRINEYTKKITIKILLVHFQKGTN